MTTFEIASIAIAALALCAAAPATHIDPALVEVLAALDHDEQPDLRGVVVLRDGRLVAERYYNGETADSLHDIRSAGKSVTSLLVGIAIDQGKIHGVGDKVSAYWPEAKGSAIGCVALRDVLTMRSGLAAFDEDPASPGNEDKLDAASDPLAFLRSIPRADPPGSRYRYNSATAYAAGVVVAKATGRSMAVFARSSLFEPLGIRRWHWAPDAARYTKGQGKLSLTARDFAAIGEMVRGEGLYRGRRIVSVGWIRDALAPKVGISDSDPYADGYGYFWYSKVQQIDGKPVAVSFASGNGGNVRMKIGDVVSGGQIRTRAIVMQQKTGRPVQFELLPDARASLLAWLDRRGGTVDDYVFPSRIDHNGHLSTRQYARLVDEWVTGVGLIRSDYGTHSLRRTKASIIYRATGNLRAVQILLGHSKIENTVRYLGIDVEDALALAENTEI